MCNQNVSTEILGGIRADNNDTISSSRYAVATLDGILMLVQDENVLWWVLDISL